MLTVGEETIDVDLGWADDPEGVRRAEAMERDLAPRARNAEHPRNTVCVLCERDPEDCDCP